MDEINRILSKEAGDRTKEELEYLHAHLNEMTEDEIQGLNNESVKSKTVLETNKIKMSDSGEVVMFSKPMPITDNSEQYNGTRYDIPSMDISGFKGHLTVNHSGSIMDIVGNVIGLQKGRNKITIDGIKFAVKENAMAQFAKDMLMGGFVTDFSIESIGPWPNDDGIYMNSALVGLSMVIVGNNKSATVNQIAYNSIEKAKKQGLDTSILEQEYPEVKETIDKSSAVSDNDVEMKFVTIKNSRNFAIEVTYKNAAGDDVKTTLQANSTIDVSEDQKDAVEKQINDAADPKAADNDVATIVKNAIKDATEPLVAKVNDLEKKIFDNSAQEPSFKKVNSTKTIDDLKNMDWRELSAKQINSAWDWLKGGNAEARKALVSINGYNLERLQEKKIVPNSITIADFGNFVINPELLSTIEGHRSNFQPLLSRVEFRETLSLEMAWLKRSGDIDMEEVENCDDGADGNLKPIKEYEATINRSNLQELAAVTPVCNAATRFLAADLLSDVAAGYRTDFDRKKAQLVIARLQQAVDSTGNKVPYNGTSDTTTLKSWIETWVKAQEEIMGGVFIFNQKTYGELLMRAIGAGISGPLAGLFTTGDQPLIAGSPYIVVPNELMPSLNSAETKSFTIEGSTVSITQAVFYADLSTFSGRTSGGLQYDLSTEASYEDGVSTKSAFQRNELVLRGSFFRGGAVRDDDKVASMFAAGVS